MKKWLMAACCMASFGSITAQHTHEWCGTDILLQQQIEQDPSLAERVEQAWSIGDAPLVQSASSRSSRDLFIIPVVFHIVHNNGVGDISYEQILDGVRMLNEDFTRTNADAVNTRSVFQPHAADSEIEFRLAKRDPDGNCTNGVVRINAPTQADNASNSVKSLSFWPSDQYLNIWVVNTIQNFSGTPGIILGYAQFPGSGSWNTYGIVIRNDRVGSIGSAQFGDRTLTNEVGHCLNLLHTFQSGCGGNCSSSGDRVCDTPPSSQATYGCNQGQNTCSNDGSGASPYSSNVVDQIENYMSYDDCQNMFSEGQKARMHNTLNNVSRLVNLTSQQNLEATGVLNPVEIICRADFETNKQVVCIGEPVEFEDLSFFSPTEWEWEFEGGSPAVSTVQHPTVTYDSPGIYEVSLRVGDGTDFASTTKQAFIEVLPGPGTHMPLEESFEYSNDLRSNYWFTDSDVSNFGWELSSEESYTGFQSLKMNNFGFNSGSTDILSPTYDLSNMTSATVSFRVAYTQRAAGNNDILRVHLSNNCGETWSLRFASGGTAMASLPTSAAPITGLNQSDWQLFSFPVDNQFLRENLRLRFYFESDGGNNLYLDDINIMGTFSDVPLLVSPTNQAPSVQNNVTLDWKATGPVDYYTIELDSSASFNSSAFQGFQQTYLGTDPNLSDTRQSTSGLEVGVTYYWRVRGVRNGTPLGWSDTWSFTVGEDNLVSSVGEPEEESLFSVFPNPAQGRVFIGKPAEATAQVYIYSTTGQQVLAQQLNAGSQQEVIQLSSLAPGLYILQLETSGKREMHRLVIE